MGHGRLHRTKTTVLAIHPCTPHGGVEAHLRVHEQWHYRVGPSLLGRTWTPARELAVRLPPPRVTGVAGATALSEGSVCPPTGASTIVLHDVPDDLYPGLTRAEGRHNHQSPSSGLSLDHRPQVQGIQRVTGVCSHVVIPF